MSVWVQAGVVVAMVLATIVAIVLFQRSLDKPGGREAWGGGGGDPFGPVNAIFNPGQARAQKNLEEYEKKREVAPSPEPELTKEGRIVIRRDRTPPDAPPDAPSSAPTEPHGSDS